MTDTPRPEDSLAAPSMPMTAHERSFLRVSIERDEARAERDALQQRVRELEGHLKAIRHEIIGDNERNALGSCIWISKMIDAAIPPAEAPESERRT